MAKKFEKLDSLVPTVLDTDHDDNYTQISKKYAGTKKLNNMRDIELKRIQPDPDQPRQHFNKEELKELAASIKANGVIQPITVEYVELKDGYKIHVGERRYKACQLLKLETIPCIIVAADDQTTITVQQLIENIHRSSLRPIEKAKGLMALKQQLNCQWTVVEKKLGITASHRERLISYLQIPEDVHEDITSESVARAIIKVKDDPKKIQEVLAELKAGKSGRQAMVLAEKIKKPKKSTDKTSQTNIQFKLTDKNFKRNSVTFTKEEVTDTIKLIKELRQRFVLLIQSKPELNKETRERFSAELDETLLVWKSLRAIIPSQFLAYMEYQRKAFADGSYSLTDFAAEINQANKKK